MTTLTITDLATVTGGADKGTPADAAKAKLYDAYTNCLLLSTNDRTPWNPTLAQREKAASDARVDCPVPGDLK